jgi:hypothetical protein
MQIRRLLAFSHEPFAHGIVQARQELVDIDCVKSFRFLCRSIVSPIGMFGD